MSRVSFCGPLTIVESAKRLSLGGRDAVVVGGYAKVVSPDGDVLFEGDWLDANEWASAHKEDW